MVELPQHRLGDIQRKVLTLHALERLGACGNLQLIAFMAEYDLMNYFDLQTALFDLREAGQVERTRLPADDVYDITPAGRETLGLFASRVADSVLRAVDEAAPGFRERIRRERELSAVISHEGGNEYHVVLRIVEQQMPLMTIDLSLPTAELAAVFRDNWADKARKVYDAVIRELSGREEA
ncbi:MAG: DUF4364 family protein [Clostridiales bacterium]|nr:DUF4364 family protein [Clostridiales bacterium]